MKINKTLSCTTRIVLVCLLLTFTSYAQVFNLSELKPENRFDFILGTWEKSDSINHGLTTYSRILNDLVIEQIDGWPNGNQSKAFLSYDNRGIWKQSWVDTWRYHLHYKGGFEDGKMILYQTSIYFESAVNQEVAARQVFSKISKEGFRWDWEISKDGGTTWEFLNGLDYRRVN